MQNQQNQWKNALIPFVFIMSFLVVFLLLFIWARNATSSIVAFAIVGIFLLLTVLSYIALWRIPNDEKWQKFILPLYTLLAIVAMAIIAFLLLATSKAGYLKQLQLDTISALFIIGIGVVSIWRAALWQLLQKKARERPPSDEEKSLEAEFQEALRCRATGWSMTPQEALKQGWKAISIGLVIGGGGLAIPVLFFLLGGSTQSLKGIIYLIMSALFLVLYLWFLFFFLRGGLRLLRAGRARREQQGGTLTIRGTAIAFWDKDRNGINGELLKLRLHDGTNKIFYIKSELFDEMPAEAGEEVEIDYLFGCEAVVTVKALSGVSSSDNGENQQSEEE